MLFNESLDAFVDPNFLDEIEELSTMYVACRENQVSTPSRLTVRLRFPSRSTIVSFLPFDLSAHAAVPRLTLPLSQLVGFAGFTVLIYDHLITFADEVRPSPISPSFTGRGRVAGTIHLEETARSS